MWKNNQFFFVDTPGYGEFIGQAAAAVRAADAALVVIDAIDGPQVGTARRLEDDQGAPDSPLRSGEPPRQGARRLQGDSRSDARQPRQIGDIPFTGRSVRATRSTAW